MKNWARDLIIATAGAVLGATTIYFAARFERPPEADRNIVFPIKVVSDLGPNGGFVGVQGTLAGEGVGYENNTVGIFCSKSDMRCLTIVVEQIGFNHIGSIEPPGELAITEWTPMVIAATSAPDGACVQTTVNIMRKTETVEWVQVPVNQTASYCIHADTKIYKWTIEDAPFWKRAKGAANP